MGVVFGGLRLAGLARVSSTVESIGLDEAKHGVRRSQSSMVHVNSVNSQTAMIKK